MSNVSREGVRLLTDMELENLLYQRDNVLSIYLELNYKVLAKELNRKGVTKKLLWEEYVQ